MNISVNNILDAGLIVHGKLPDLYWNIDDLTGSELKVLRYVYNNCLRLYKDLKYYPKGKDGSPRLWRGKERMADDCGLSYVTFRKNVRHLAELGLVTSMDGVEDEEELYCIGLSSVYVENLVNSNTVKNFRLHNLIDLINLMYDSITVDIIDLNKIKNIPSLLRNELHDTNEFGLNTEEQPTQPTGASSNSKKIKRTPIYVKRCPISTIPEIIRNQTYSQKLQLLKNIRTPHEKKIYEMSEYYEFKCRKALHSTGFRSLGKSAQESKNWKYYEKVLELCEQRGWDYKIYFDSQFDRVHYWRRKQVYPYLNQMLSDRAIQYYEKYVTDIKLSTSVTGNAKVKSEKVKTTKQIIIDQVIRDCESVTSYITQASKYRSNRGLTPEQLKVLYIADHWMSLSSYYLSVIPWFMKHLDTFPEEPVVVNLKNNISVVQKSKSLLNTTSDIVDKVEKQLNVPKTLCL